MHQPVACVAIVSPSNRGREALRALLTGMDWVLVETDCASYGEFQDVCAGSRLDGALLVLDEQPTEALQVLAHVAQRHPRTSIIALSNRPELLIQAHRRGAKALLDYPPALEDLSAALKNLAAGISLNRVLNPTVTTVMGTRGGAGATTVAVNLAAALAAQSERQVALLDFDMITGAVEVALQLSSKCRLDEVLAHIAKLDLQWLKTLLTHHRDGLTVLPRSYDLTTIDAATPEAIQRLLTLIRIIHSDVVVEVSRGWSPADRRAIEFSERILLVTQPEVVAVHNAVLLVETLKNTGWSEKLHLVVNKVGADFGADGLSLKKVEETFQGLPLTALAYDSKTVQTAWTEGRPVGVINARSRFFQGTCELAHQLTTGGAEVPRARQAAQYGSPAAGPAAAGARAPLTPHS